MREAGSVNMVSRVSGVMGKLGKRSAEGADGPVSVEVLSVGPLARDVDYKRLYWDMIRAPFYKHVPI